jgi:hypothetical protein
MAKERKGLKLRRCSKLAPKYKLQFGLTDRNKKRFLQRHIRNHPNDRQAIARYELNMGSAVGVLANLTAKGRKRKQRAEARKTDVCPD